MGIKLNNLIVFSVLLKRFQKLISTRRIAMKMQKKMTREVWSNTFTLLANFACFYFLNCKKN